MVTSDADIDALLPWNIELEMELSSFQPTLFVFSNRQRGKMKLLFWERNRFVLWYKRLEKQRFKWPRQLGQISGEQLSWLFDGIRYRASATPLCTVSASR